jgi:ADP-heptose:LPS heptosyltransferase
MFYMGKKYHSFVFFSAGPVGDHVLQIDFANYLYESSRTPSVLVLKHPNPFLRDLALPYRDHIQDVNFVGTRGVLRMLLLTLESVFRRNCFLLIFPIKPPRYLVLFSYFIRFCTRSRIVGFNLEGTKSFPEGEGYASFLGKENTIPLLPEMYYKSVERMISFLGLPPINRLPKLGYIESPGVFKKLRIPDQGYIVMHIKASHPLRSFPPERWNTIIKDIHTALPNTKIIFTGGSGDVSFIQEAVIGIPEANVVIAAGKTNTQELLTLYAHAKVNVTVQTGNGLIINLLHVPTVVVNIKGTAMFYYDFNEKATILYSTKDCTCNPFETECTMVPYKGEEYMACLFNISEEEVVRAVIEKVKTP